MKISKVLKILIRLIVLTLLFPVFFVLGSMFLKGLLPADATDPGIVSDGAGIIIISIVNAVLIFVLINSSRLKGWRLMAVLSVCYYGAVTFVMQLETWYFLSDVTVSPEVLKGLFLMGLPVAFIFIPAAVVICGKSFLKNNDCEFRIVKMPSGQWMIKSCIAGAAYVVLYWLAGYFIAWQNPEVRSFYSGTTDLVPFFAHTINTAKSEPLFFPFQFLRGLIWTAFAVPLIFNSDKKIIFTSVLIGIFVSFPQNAAHILSNPIIPSASIRMSHLIETASSTFLFGVIVTVLFFRKHESVQDFFNFK